MSAPIEGKVYASTIGAALGAVSGFIIWGLGVFVWGAPSTAAAASDAAAAVPAPVVALLLVVLPPLGAFVGGFWAKHTPRVDPVDDTPEVDDTSDLVNDELDQSPEPPAGEPVGPDGEAPAAV